MSIGVRLAGVLLAGGAVLIVGCAQTGTAESAGRSVSPGATSPAPTPPIMSATAVSPSAGAAPDGASAAPATPEPAPVTRRPTLRFGAHNDDVKALQEKLRGLHYDPGAADGKYGQTTQLALFAFQKVNRLKPNGTVGESVWKALDAPRTPTPLVRGGKDERVEIDLGRQLLYVYRDGELALISHTSSGGGYKFCTTDPGATTQRCRYAVTPTGDFNTGRRVAGWDKGPLGSLYKPVYFNGGIAVHGYPSVPLTPVSHGCVRVPMHTADVFQTLVGTGVPVHVRGKA
ncbi:L,D-transpeptidase family protein [Actinomadura sp. HBU206391]|uniref:L,D-transpeptidase family protein n=1 Tax=Actinomadura sp. HBU206391 TaxID=2731692 RepID=UPI0016508BE7|nr:L,D-transpeptidase family protein [Actinomadura sp. HBU206391]MBC6462447.1 murein L,D-transpeptidase [Actinomadura sp. HBU206391]